MRIAARAHDQEPVLLRPLRVRDVHRGLRRQVERALAHVLHHADDLLHPLDLPAEVDAPAERALAREEAVGEGLIDDDHRRCAGAIAIVEGAAGEHRRAQHVEVAGRDDPLLGERLRVGRKLAALDDDGAVDAAVERQVVDVGRGAHLRQRRHPLAQLLEEAVCWWSSG